MLNLYACPNSYTGTIVYFTKYLHHDTNRGKQTKYTIVDMVLSNYNNGVNVPIRIMIYFIFIFLHHGTIF